MKVSVRSIDQLSFSLLLYIKVPLLWDLQVQKKKSLQTFAIMLIALLGRSNFVNHQKCYFYSFKWTKDYLLAFTLG